jgi:hypothetical protein
VPVARARKAVPPAATPAIVGAGSEEGGACEEKVEVVEKGSAEEAVSGVSVGVCPAASAVADRPPDSTGVCVSPAKGSVASPALDPACALVVETAVARLVLSVLISVVLSGGVALVAELTSMILEEPPVSSVAHSCGSWLVSKAWLRDSHCSWNV